MALKIISPALTGSNVSLTASQGGISVSRSRRWGLDALQYVPPKILSGGVVTVPGGRVVELSDPDAATVASISVTTPPAVGKLTVNPSNTLALTLTGSSHSGPLSFDYSVTRTDTSVENKTASLDVTTPTQDKSWGVGNVYMLETDASGNLIVETGVNHRRLYISGSPSALTAADIATLEGLDVSAITVTWLRDNPSYGGTEGMALAQAIGMDLWYFLTDARIRSHWLLFERGYDYGDVGRLIGRGSMGESPINPLHITSWGVGERPIIGSLVRSFQDPNANIVISDISLAGGIQNLGTCDNLLLDRIKFDGGKLNIQAATGFTLRNSEVLDVVDGSPIFRADGTWDASPNRISGIYMEAIFGSLFENNLFLHNGWAEGYDGTDQAGMPPSFYSHNVYFQYNNSDLTFRDNITAQGASFGAQFRSGGHIENNLFLDNNAALNLLGGDYKERGPIGDYSLLMNNVITSAGYKKALVAEGALDMGIGNEARDSTLLGNIVAHRADPNNPDELTKKFQTFSFAPVTNDYPPFFDDTIIFDWHDEYNANIDGLDPAALNQITIQNFAMEFLGLTPATAPASADMGMYYKSGLIYALMDYARENWGDGSLTAKGVIDWFKAGFGISTSESAATSHMFAPNSAADGIRWDNKLNWSNGVVPSNTHTVSLNGSHVRTYATFDGTVNLQGGKLTIVGGKIKGSIVGPGEVVLELAGQNTATLSAGATLTDNR